MRTFPDKQKCKCLKNRMHNLKRERPFAVSFVDNTMISTKEGVFWIIRPPRFAIELENMFIERF